MQQPMLLQRYSMTASYGTRWEKAREDARALEEHNIGECWSKLFHSLTAEKNVFPSDSVNKKEFSVFSRNAELALKQLQRKYLKGQEIQQNMEAHNMQLSFMLKQESENLRLRTIEVQRSKVLLEQTLNSKRYRLESMLLAIPSKLMDMIKSLTK